METTEERGEGWYPDPFARLAFRWWDGKGWTAYAAAADQVVQWDPEPFEERVAVSPGLPGLVAALVGAIAAVGLSLLVIVVLRAAGRQDDDTQALVLSQLGLWAGLVGACVFVSWRRGTRSIFRDFDFRFRWADLGFGLAGAIAGRFVSAAFAAPFPVSAHRLRDLDRSVFGEHAPWLVLILITCVGAPLIEELFFRGLLQTRLVGRIGVVPGIAVASLLFGAAHMINWQGIDTFAYAWAIAGGGLVLGIIRQVSGRLGPGIVAHSMFNAIALIVFALLN
jgi:hypothetical protein